MREEAHKDVNGAHRVLSVLLVLALMMANSALFYFVIWDMFRPSNRFAVILFFVSGGAHLTYFFLPWFIKSQLAPVFSDTVTGGGGSGTADAGGFFVKLCVQMGLALCVTTLLLWALQQEFPWSAPEEDFKPLITEANCLKIGGTPTYVDGRLACVLSLGQGRGTTPADGQTGTE